MRKSGKITLVILGGLMLSGCLCGGCGRPSRARTFYDKQHNVVPRDRWMGPDGQPAELYDENGNPVPADEVRTAYSHPTSHSSSSRWGWGPVFWSRPWYSSGRSWGGSSSSSGSGSSWFGKSSSSSISRGGFGGTGHSVTGGGS